MRLLSGMNLYQMLKYWLYIMAEQEEMQQPMEVAIAPKQTLKGIGNLMKEVDQPSLMPAGMEKTEQDTEQPGQQEVTLNHNLVPLTFNAGTQLNLNSPNCGTDHTSLCTNNKIAVNQNIIFTDTDISGTGIIIATGKITLKQNSTIAGGITLIANEIEFNNSSLGNSSLFNSVNGPVIVYSEMEELIHLMYLD